MESWSGIRGLAASGGRGRKSFRGVRIELICCSIWNETLNRVSVQANVPVSLCSCFTRQDRSWYRGRKASADPGWLPAEGNPQEPHDRGVPAQSLPQTLPKSSSIASPRR